MTVTVEPRKQRKESWDSAKMSVSTTTSSLQREWVPSATTPSSLVSSTSSDIRFTRKFDGQYRRGCCGVAAFLLFMLASAIAIYLVYTLAFTDGDPPLDLIYRGMFRIEAGDAYDGALLADPSSPAYVRKARHYKELLNMVMRRSPLRVPFLETHILALDGDEGRSLMVHFEMQFEPRRMQVSTEDVARVLLSEIELGPSKSVYFANLTIPPQSLFIKESTEMPTASGSGSSTSSTTMPPPPREPRRCRPLELELCSSSKILRYNTTSYPNKLGHLSIQDVKADVIAFRELMDAECYRHAYEFICQLLQPPCRDPIREGLEAEPIWPCRSFCEEFQSGCGSRLPVKFLEALDCQTFPEHPTICTQSPGCVRELKERGFTSHLCDGVADCPDFADEQQTSGSDSVDCKECPSGSLLCAAPAFSSPPQRCIPKENRCDGKKDCPDGSDERQCLTLAPSAKIISANKIRGSVILQPNFFNEGFVVFHERGRAGKLCTETLNSTIPDEFDRENVLHTVATSLCSVLHYSGVEAVRVLKDDESDVEYVHMEDPAASEISFVRAPCPSKHVLHVTCSSLECGHQTLRSNKGLDGLGKKASPGDWPWHVALFKDGVHVCDASIISDRWLLTTASCFQGQPKAEWLAKAGTVRASGRPPWLQERAIVGLVKSPVEGSTLALVKLETPLIWSDHVHSVCLPETSSNISSAYCTTLGWASTTREYLQRVELKIVDKSKCDNISITSFNSICTDVPYSASCDEEELAGSPMLCLQENGSASRWTLIGLSNWRIACSQAGMERPRLYDKTLSNLAWIKQTLENTS